VKIIDELVRDHRNMRILFDIIDEEMTAYRKGRTPDYAVLGMIAEYILDYPNVIHHPKEDLVFKHLAIRDPGAMASLGNLINEHKRLAELTRRFAVAMANTERHSESPRKWLSGLADDYLVANRAHMRLEEAYFFPRAMARLTQADWLEIAQSRNRDDDPVFGNNAAGAYHRLYERIVKLRR
jgi:hemerythrin-like domain-containing protein